jgi:4-hydroxybenzoate polyprenyltransferase
MSIRTSSSLLAAVQDDSPTNQDADRGVPILQAAIKLMLTEFEITWRMLADNIVGSFTPGLVFVVAACLRKHATSSELVLTLGKAIVLSGLYTYTFDALNQARGGDEDKINKPHRPIPRGLISPKSIMRRFWMASAIYAASGWLFGVLEWALLWTFTTVIMNVWCTPRHYFWCKTLCMMSGTWAQLSQAWQLVEAPIDDTGRQWISFLALVFPFPLIFEDVRDMTGDKAIGRRTLALLLGAWPVRIWFATTTALLPALVHHHLFKPTEAAPWRVALCTAFVASISWTAGARSTLLRTVSADRVTYQIFIMIYIVVLSCGCILWA